MNKKPTVQDCEDLVNAVSRLSSFKSKLAWQVGRREEIRKELHEAHARLELLQLDITMQELKVMELKIKVGVQ